MERVIYCFWTGENEMSFQRKHCLEMMHRSRCDINLITSGNLSNYVKKEFPLHPAYSYLSLTHRSDYLRCYFMHHFGGGYSDIKEIESPWSSAFEDMKQPNIYINGYQEVGPEGVAHVKGELYKELRRNYRCLIGLGAFICKPNTPFTNEWIKEVHKRLDAFYEPLKEKPAMHPRDYYKRVINTSYPKYRLMVTSVYNRVFNQSVNCSKYPINWSGILGDIFHPLCLKYKDHIMQTVPKPKFHDYQ